MDTIKNYLETMFLQLPNTREVLKAKAELGQMMEDKYNELKAEGKPENEAVGTVLSEFGNLDELAEGLGISAFMNPAAIEKRIITMDEAISYITLRAQHALYVALGVLLCVISPCGFIVNEAYNQSEATGIIFFFGCIAVGVSLFIYVGQTHKVWDFLKKSPCAVEFATIDRINDEKILNRNLFILCRIFAIALVILGVGVAAFADELNLFGSADDIIGGIFLASAGICAALLVFAGIREGSYDRLLTLNDSKTIGGNYVDNQKNGKKLTKTGRAIMSVYWPTVTCVYFIVSFLTFRWHLTWLIWVVGAICQNLISIIFEENE